MALWDKLTFKAVHVEISSQMYEVSEEYNTNILEVAFLPVENFNALIARLARMRTDEEVTMAVYALESEMAKRCK